nr:MAG TPA: hypothetical protein [Caudoviricetes sp.]
MNNSMVAHLWANEKKESGKGSNLFFEGRVFILMVIILRLEES